jgi:hypothetical protein
MKHERDVFQDYPGHGTAVDKSKDMLHQSGTSASDSGRTASLAEVLARKAGDEKLDVAR